MRIINLVLVGCMAITLVGCKNDYMYRTDKETQLRVACWSGYEYMLYGNGAVPKFGEDGKPKKCVAGEGLYPPKEQ